MQRYPDGTSQTSVGGHSGRKCGSRRYRAFWFNHLVQSFSSPDTVGREGEHWHEGAIPDVVALIRATLVTEAGAAQRVSEARAGRERS